MANNGRTEWSPGFRPGRRQREQFSHLVSPLGADAAETPTYSPSREVTGAAPQGKGRASQSEHAKNERRGG